jgi:predicted transcriptional regulator
MARGSSDILAAMDGALYLHKYEGDIKAEHAKARWSEPLEPFLVKIAAGGGTLRMHHAGAVPEKRTERQRIRDFIGAALRASDNGLRRTELLSRCAIAGHKRSQTVTQALREMVDAGLITGEKQGRESTYRWRIEEGF